VNRRLKYFECGVEGRHRDVFVEILDGDFVQPFGAGLSRAPKPTSLPASDCSSSVVCSRMWPIHVPRRSRSKNPRHALAAPMFDHRRQPAHQPVVETIDHLG